MLKGDLRACVPDRLPGVANGNFSLNVLCWYAVALLLLLLFFFQFLPQLASSFSKKIKSLSKMNRLLLVVSLTRKGVFLEYGH